ncbi:putative transcriptional regulator [Priestia megaterium]|nr:putative transcriptional regulator [Priestia megaterium]
MEITRQSMKEMLKRERLDQSAIWSAAIHYNTDNIHIHVATVEPHPTRDRGKRKPKTLDAMKSKVVSQILERGQEQKEINDLIRKNMVGSKKQDSSFKWRNRELKPLFLHIYNHLPEDKRQWQYSYNTLKPLRSSIDTLSEKYIQKYHAKEFEQFNKKLDQEVEVLRKAYGEGTFDKKRYERYKQNKTDELYKRMGNAFLSEMREYDRKQTHIKKVLASSGAKQKVYSANHLPVHVSLKKIERAFKSEYESWKNQQHYERLQKDIEQNREVERGY